MLCYNQATTNFAGLDSVIAVNAIVIPVTTFDQSNRQVENEIQLGRLCGLEHLLPRSLDIVADTFPACISVARSAIRRRRSQGIILRLATIVESNGRPARASLLGHPF